MLSGPTYFKRYRMELDLREVVVPVVVVPEGYDLIPWDDGLLASHAEVLWASFRDEIDADVFPCLGDHSGCVRLMQAIRFRPGFCASGTWLLGAGLEYVGTVQTVRNPRGEGAIQNVGVTPGHRGRGLGTILLWSALAGMRSCGVQRVSLEVTAINAGALELYRRLGFRACRTIYKRAESAAGPAVADPTASR
jgi:ribosomal protein S18 acetylase RimI-like enzyme